MFILHEQKGRHSSLILPKKNTPKQEKYQWNQHVTLVLKHMPYTIKSRGLIPGSAKLNTINDHSTPNKKVKPKYVELIDIN